jgi:hypothetical protein
LIDVNRGHEAIVIKLPVLIAVGAVPATRVVVPFISGAYRDALPVERPQFLDEPVVQLLGPLAREKSNDFVSSVDKLRAVPSSRIDRVCQSYFFRVPSVPPILGEAHLLNRTLAGAQRQRGRAALPVRPPGLKRVSPSRR